MGIENKDVQRSKVNVGVAMCLKELEVSEEAAVEGLQKAESFLLIQLRTRKIGLRAFLFERRVPDVIPSLCPRRWQTARHGGSRGGSD
jgi:hypothetical protein